MIRQSALKHIGRWLSYFLLLHFLLRIWMWYYERDSAALADHADVLIALVTGIANDSIIFFLLLSLVVCTLLVHRLVGQLMLAVLILLAVLFVILDVFFWIDFDGRADRLVFHYLAYPVEVLVFLEDQFTLSLLILPLLLLVYLLYRLFMPGMTAIRIQLTERPWLALVAPCCLALWWVWHAPIMPWPSRHLNDLGSNGMQKVLHASRVDETRWEGVFTNAQKPRPKVKAQLHYNAASHPLDPIPKHVLLIIEESLAGPNWWDEERRAKYMPNFDRWRKKGVYLSRLMATGTRTTRGVEAMLHGLPPLPGIALNQRQGFEKLSSLPRTLKQNGFETTFVYGGWPGFSNFKAYWSAIGFDTVITRDNFAAESFATSWGVADEILFDRVLEEMHARTKSNERVFLSTLTVTNHRPYDFPEGRIDFPADQRKQEYAVAYADWALGRFLDTASQQSWFKDTLIIVAPDHGPNPEGDLLIPIESFRLPGIVLAPGLTAGERDGVGSLMDIPKTVLSSLGLDDTEAFLGRNLLAEHVSGAAPVEYDYLLGLYDGVSLTVLRRDQSSITWRRDHSGQFVASAIDIEQTQLTAGLFRMAHKRYVESNTILPTVIGAGAAMPYN